jgi:FkbM family methyltransferase
MSTSLLHRLSAGRKWYPRMTVRDGVGRGLRMSLRNASADYVVGTNELPVQWAVRDHLHDGDVFLDVGANIGFFSMVAARIVGPTGHVYAFEPVPANARCIDGNARANRFENIDVLCVAVGALDGDAPLLLCEHPGGATLALSDEPFDATTTIDVHVVTLDRLVAEGTIRRPTFVKIDVEGFEREVLDGMAAILRHHRPSLLVELDAATSTDVAAKVTTISDCLRTLGYEPDELPRSYGEDGWQVRHLLALGRTPTGA